MPWGRLALGGGRLFLRKRRTTVVGHTCCLVSFCLEKRKRERDITNHHSKHILHFLICPGTGLWPPVVSRGLTLPGLGFNFSVWGPKAVLGFCCSLGLPWFPVVSLGIPWSPPWSPVVSLGFVLASDVSFRFLCRLMQQTVPFGSSVIFCLAETPSFGASSVVVHQLCLG